MKQVSEDFRVVAASKALVSEFDVTDHKKPTHKITRDCPRVTVRFSRDDYERLQEMADGAALSVYLRAKVLEEKLPKRKMRSGSSIQDKQAIAQLLGLLGQSRIANNIMPILVLCRWMMKPNP